MTTLGGSCASPSSGGSALLKGSKNAPTVGYARADVRLRVVCVLGDEATPKGVIPRFYYKTWHAVQRVVSGSCLVCVSR